MTPSQKGVLWDNCRGMKTLFLPVAVTQIPPDPQFSQGGMHYDYNAIPSKTIKEMKQACTQYGTNPPYTMGLIQVLSQAEQLIPYDWEMIARTWYPPQNFYNLGPGGRMRQINKLTEMRQPTRQLI